MSNKKLYALIFNEEDFATGSIRGIRTTTGASFDMDPDTARSVLGDIERAARDADVPLEDAVIVFKAQNGQVKLQQTRDATTGRGALRGSFWGLLVGLIFGGPLAGLLWGLGLGALYGGVIDHGIDDDFLRDVGSALKPRTSAVLLLIDEAYAEDASAYLKTFDVEMHVSDMSEETENAVAKAAENEQVAQAVSAELASE